MIKASCNRAQGSRSGSNQNESAPLNLVSRIAHPAPCCMDRGSWSIGPWSCLPSLASRRLAHRLGFSPLHASWSMAPESGNVLMFVNLEVLSYQTTTRIPQGFFERALYNIYVSVKKLDCFPCVHVFSCWCRKNHTTNATSKTVEITKSSITKTTRTAFAEREWWNYCVPKTKRK